MVIVLAGLPGTGKSTLARRLATELGGVVLDKDAVRAALFPPPAIDYSQEQDDLCMAAIYSATAYVLRAGLPVILDGRTYSKRYQVRDLMSAAASWGETPRFVECICDDAVARQRLEQAQADGGHLAGNRSFALYRQLKATADELQGPKLVLDTGQLTETGCLGRAIQHVTQRT